jgi:hypothetical protein
MISRYLQTSPDWHVLAVQEAPLMLDPDTICPLTSPRPHDEVLGNAIRVLTEAARLTNTPMRQTSTGTWEPDPTAAPLPIDWTAFVALAGAAANIGSVYRILAGQPGSWEAARHSTGRHTVGHVRRSTT